MKYNRQTRRMFLQGAGGALAIPFLSSLLPREAWAQSPATIKRAIFFNNNYDYGRHQNWFPTSAQPAQKLTSATGDRTLSYAPLSSYISSSSAPLSPIFGTTMNPYLRYINLVRGLDISTRTAHNSGVGLGNLRENDADTDTRALSPMRTIDQFLRDHTGFNPNRRDVVVIGNLQFSYRRNADGSISRASNTADTPRALFNYLFNNGTLPETGTTTTPTAHPRRDLLTNVLEDYNRLKNGRQISSADRIALTNATDLISDIQRNLAGTTTVTGACRYKSIPTAGDGESYYLSTATLKAYADIMVAAMMCDVARVFNWSAYIDENVYDKNPNEDFHQGHSHIPFTTINGKVNWQYMGEIQNAFVRNFLGPLMAGMSAIDPSNNQSYLYNSLVHYSVECGQLHGHNSHPCFMAGNLGGALPSGYLLDYTDRSRPHRWTSDGYSDVATDPRFSDEWVGVPINRLFNTILQASGVTPAEYENPAINQHFQNRTDGRFGANNNGIASMGGYGHWGPFASSVYTTDYLQRQPLYDLRFFKNKLPMPATSAS